MNFHTISDGGGTEGIGALLQYQLFCYGYCILNNSSFSFNGFTNLQHFQYTSQTQKQFSDTVSNFCGLPVTEINKSSTYLDPLFLMEYGQKNIDKIVPLLTKIKINNISDCYFDLSKINIAVHIRMFTKTDCDPSTVRECHNHIDLKKTLEYYTFIFKRIKTLYPNKQLVFHIYSQGSLEQFDVFKEIFSENTEYHLDEHPIISLQHMIYSDVLVMANSSLSYVAHLYGRNKCIAKPTFYHSLYTPNII